MKFGVIGLFDESNAGAGHGFDSESGKPATIGVGWIECVTTFEYLFNVLLLVRNFSRAAVRGLVDFASAHAKCAEDHNPGFCGRNDAANVSHVRASLKVIVRLP
jgi:hypothetical protein